MRITDLPEIGKLSIPEKILLREDLWENIASDEICVPVPQSHIGRIVYDVPRIHVSIKGKIGFYWQFVI